MWGWRNCLWWWISRARLESSLFADLRTTCTHPLNYILHCTLFMTHLWPICKFMRSQIDLSEGPFPYQAPQGVISNGPQIFRRELSVRHHRLAFGISDYLRLVVHTPVAHDMNWQAITRGGQSLSTCFGTNSRYTQLFLDWRGEHYLSFPTLRFSFLLCCLHTSHRSLLLLWKSEAPSPTFKRGWTDWVGAGVSLSSGATN